MIYHEHFGSITEKQKGLLEAKANGIKKKRKKMKKWSNALIEYSKTILTTSLP